MTRCVFKNSFAPYAAVFIGHDATPEIRDCVFSGNRGLAGGAIRAYLCVSSISRCVFDSNQADIGGAISGNRAELQVTDCVFINNQSNSGGGCIYASYPATLTAERCLFRGNGGYSGSVGSAQDGLLILRNCTLAANRSPVSALYAWDSGVVQVENSIIAFSPEGQAAACENGTVELHCSDVFGNHGGDWTACIAPQYDGFENLCLDPRFRDPAGGDYSIWPDSPCAAKNNPMCGQIGAYPARTEDSSAPQTTFAREFAVNVEPSPAAGICRLSWDPARAANVVVRIFDTSGRQIRELVSRGRAEITWDRRDDQGRPVATGVYLARASATDGHAATRIILYP